MTENELREKVIKGLECCIAYDYKCNNCPYQDDGGAEDGCYSDELKANALALLKAQEPHVMTEAELRAIQSETPVWVEVPFEGCDFGHWVLISYQQYIYKGLRRSFDDGALEGIGVKWRCWTSRPDYETRRDTPW